MTGVRWGVLGTGSIARTVVGAHPGAFVAVASRDAARAAAFGLDKSFGSYADLVTGITRLARRRTLRNVRGSSAKYGAMYTEWSASRLNSSHWWST